MHKRAVLRQARLLSEARLSRDSRLQVAALKVHNFCIGAAVGRAASTMAGRTVTLDNMNPHLITMEYAVRGPIVIRAGEIEKELKAGKKFNFTEVIRANIGDCHAMGQVPLTFFRQVIAACAKPDLMKGDLLPADVKSRAQRILEGCGGKSVGAYSDSAGVEIIRKHVAEYISERDGLNAKYEDVILSTGASESVRSVLNLLNVHKDGKPSGVMIPIPQYPLYSATLAEYGIHQINYYLDEENDWALSIRELERSLNEAKKVCNPRGLVVINPGNPTGSVLTEQNIKQVVEFAYKHKLFLMADEVYQHNIYAEGAAFHSFHKIMHNMGPPYSDMELASFMSASKGYMGECGLRGGYVEVINLDPAVKRVLLKSVSAKLCSSVLGQSAMDCVVNPPKPGEPSYDLFVKEKTAVLDSLKKRAELVADTFNSFEGFSCNKVAGAMYAFPKFTLPQKAIEEAKAAGQAPDFFYVMQLLENTGVCVVPGSGFGQIPGTYHFRTTILPPLEKLQVMLAHLKGFHQKFMDKYK
ncbi:alanine aminotransferase 1 [Dermacentor variabilis]|uniref:alanine aminotransferase 1 n=1 Tax=Dermacentor variabilis TaxID=34621 RepID=UPI003F5B6ED7